MSEEKKLWERYKSGDKTVGPLHGGPGYQYIVSYEKPSSSSERIKPDLNENWEKNPEDTESKADMSENSSEEDLVREFLLCPIGSATTDQSQGKDWLARLEQ